MKGATCLTINMPNIFKVTGNILNWVIILFKATISFFKTSAIFACFKIDENCNFYGIIEKSTNTRERISPLSSVFCLRCQ